MLEPWNNKSLLPPPVNTTPIKNFGKLFYL